MVIFQMLGYMTESLNVSKSEVVMDSIMIARRLLQDEKTGKISKEILDRFKDTPPL